jgi:Pyruvate/2-oxoacid:ferredoxin oxidoreductase delta subunit/flavodoxin
MKTCIYTFSGTGTALSIADQACGILTDAKVRLIPKLLEQTNGEINAEAPKIGFVFPNYFGGIPNAVQRFIQRLNLDGVHYIFAVVTAGGGQGYSLKYLQKELQHKDKALNYGRYVKGVSNYIVASYYIGLTEEKQGNILRALREKIQLYSDEIKADRNFVERSNPIVFGVNRLLSLIYSREAAKDTSGGDRDYSISEKCTGCGICQKVCQANNIVMTDNKPVYCHKCYRCMACIQYCPQNAILFKGNELNKQKFTHPDFTSKKMISRIMATG